MPPNWFPHRGDVYWIRLDKERPALVISSDSLNRHSLDVCVIPISTVEHRAFSLRPPLPSGEAGLARDSWAKCDQCMTVEKSSLVYPPVGRLSPAALARVEDAVRRALEL